MLVQNPGETEKSINGNMFAAPSESCAKTAWRVLKKFPESREKFWNLLIAILNN